MTIKKKVLHFSPKYSFEQIDIALKENDKDTLIEAFKNRICGFYLEPAKKLNCLNKDDSAFAVGVLCVTTIDCLACITCRPQIPCISGTVKTRFEGWVEKNLTIFNKTLAHRFYVEFRNGLLHEGRIKNGGQFSNYSRNLVDMLDGVMLVNPYILLKKINESFETCISKIEKDDPEYLFSWDEISGYENFLKQKFSIDWVKTASIEKIDNGNTICASTGKKSLLLKLNNEKTKVNLEIGNVWIDEFIAKAENGKLNIYDSQFYKLRKYLKNFDKELEYANSC